MNGQTKQEGQEEGTQKLHHFLLFPLLPLVSVFRAESNRPLKKAHLTTERKER